MKRSLLTIIVLIAIATLTIYGVGYHGPRDFSGANKLPEIDVVIENARSLSGTPYDPLMGMYGNIGAKAGFIVCSDVPNIAYGLSSFSWKEVLESDYRNNPKFYDPSQGNKPGNPYFHRRARNLYSYFKANNRLKNGDYAPRVGDMVFYRKTDKGYISHVALVTGTIPQGYKIMESAPKTLVAQEVYSSSPIERGWIFAGFGSVYN